MIIRKTKKIKKPLINIVRRKEQIDELKKLGADIVLDSTGANFLTNLRSECRKF